jgi:hypothetical protein
MAAAQRIPVLWTTAWRASNEVYNPALRSARAAAFRAYHPTRRRKQEQVPQQRYGTANEPPPHLGGAIVPSNPDKTGEQAKSQPKIGSQMQQVGEEQVQTSEQDASGQKRDPTTVEGRSASQMTDPMLDSSEDQPASEPPGSPAAPPDKPLASMLHGTGSPAEAEIAKHQDDAEHAEDHPDKTFDEHSPPIKAPHIEQPRYVHHFDTYGLVKRLAEGGIRQEQAITVMKAVRLMLADNTDLAKEALVSKSQLENEAYLFKAACAELRTEVIARRKNEQEKMRTERTQLQHEVDILSQRLGQESVGLKDDLKGMFDDRKMAVRNEQRDMERQISQLNYKITVELQADAKSEIEGLRLVMTRRVILTLGIIVGMVIAGLKIASDSLKDSEESVKRQAKHQAALGDAGTQTESSEEIMRRLGPEQALAAREGDSAGLVSLG